VGGGGGGGHCGRGALRRAQYSSKEEGYLRGRREGGAGLSGGLAISCSNLFASLCTDCVPQGLFTDVLRVFICGRPT
jgi:hypothetical protein